MRIVAPILIALALTVGVSATIASVAAAESHEEVKGEAKKKADASKKKAEDKAEEAEDKAKTEAEARK
ncbi:MAG: hypothetical protein EP303_05085, partial [Deltaproteobacteria bacterium]